MPVVAAPDRSALVSDPGRDCQSPIPRGRTGEAIPLRFPEERSTRMLFQARGKIQPILMCQPGSLASDSRPPARWCLGPRYRSSQHCQPLPGALLDQIAQSQFNDRGLAGYPRGTLGFLKQIGIQIERRSHAYEYAPFICMRQAIASNGRPPSGLRGRIPLGLGIRRTLGIPPAPSFPAH